MNNPPPATAREGSEPLLRLGSTGPQARHASLILQRVQGRLNEREAWRRASQNSAIKAFTFNLARYLTEAVPDIGGEHPLLVGCLNEGLEGWRRSERSAHPARHPLLGYVRGALFLLPQALAWEVGWSDASGASWRSGSRWSTPSAGGGRALPHWRPGATGRRTPPMSGSVRRTVASLRLPGSCGAVR